MKKILSILLSLVLLVGCSSTGESSQSKEVSSTNDNQTVAVPTPEPDVSITISSQFLEGFDMNAEDYMAGLSEGDKEAFKEVKANDDGSITIVMTAEKNKEFMDEYKVQISAQLQEMIDDQESFSNITDIKYNENLSIFTVTLANPEVTFQDAMSVIIFYLSGSMYQMFSGTPEENIDVIVNYVDADNNIIETSKLSEFKNN